MDFQHRPGGKTGTGGVASWSDSNRDRRERLRQLALETIDLQKDPYFMKNHLGTYECKLCLTLHNNEGSYLAHTQGKKHQQNLARRAAEMAKDSPVQPAPEKPGWIRNDSLKLVCPRDPDSGQQSMLFQIDYPEIAEGVLPRHSAYEQRVEPPDRLWQYLLFAAEPYETIAFKVPSQRNSGGGFGGMGGRSSGVLRDLETQKAKAAAAQMQLAMQQPPPPPPPPPVSMSAPPRQPPPPPPDASSTAARPLLLHQRSGSSAPTAPPPPSATAAPAAAIDFSILAD
uniref:Matrin-type domain-containing protein n=1 Tax=Macrostomum lignano TaxID=282301 RepID=A0A1I8F5D5_9PLAT